MADFKEKQTPDNGTSYVLKCFDGCLWEQRPWKSTCPSDWMLVCCTVKLQGPSISIPLCIPLPPSLLELHRVTAPSFFSGSLKGCGKSEEAGVSYIWVKHTLLWFMFNEYFCTRKKESLRPMLQGQKFISKERNRLKVSEAKRQAQERD